MVKATAVYRQHTAKGSLAWSKSQQGQTGQKYYESGYTLWACNAMLTGPDNSSTNYICGKTSVPSAESPLNLGFLPDLFQIRQEPDPALFGKLNLTGSRALFCNLQSLFLGLERYQVRHPIPNNIGLSQCQYQYWCVMKH